MNNPSTLLQEFNYDELVTLSSDGPLFVFSKKKIIENFKMYKRLFPGAHIKYAMKANSEPELLQLLADEGSGFEVASIGELKILKKLNVDPKKLVYGSSIKPLASIKAFYEYGVDRFAFDSLPELEKIAAAAPGSRVYVRMIANDSGSVYKFSEKFGTESENIIPLLLKAKELGLKPYGISFHVGSQASNAKAWGAAIEKLQDIIKELHGLGITLEVIDMGGGYPCQYQSSMIMPTLDEIAEHTYAAFNKLPYELKLMLEPGRGMVADTAIAVGNVIARVERKGNTWLFLDLGVYNGLFETMAYQGSTRYPLSSLRPATNEGESIFELAGPTGDSPDVITREALLPRDMAVGDKIVFYNVGAYTLPFAGNFNGFSKPKVVFV